MDEDEPYEWVAKSIRHYRTLRRANVAVAAFCVFGGLWRWANGGPLWLVLLAMFTAAMQLKMWQDGGRSMRFFQEQYDLHHGDAGAEAS